MNCPRCTAPYSSTSNFCFHCGNTLRPGMQVGEDQNSKKIKTLLIILAVFFMGEAFLWVVQQLMERFFHFNLWRISRPVFLLFSLCYAAIPLIIASGFPKDSKVKPTLMIVGIIFCVIKSIWTLYLTFEYFSAADY